MLLMLSHSSRACSIVLVAQARTDWHGVIAMVMTPWKIHHYVDGTGAAGILMFSFVNEGVKVRVCTCYHQTRAKNAYV